MVFEALVFLVICWFKEYSVTEANAFINILNVLMAAVMTSQ
jgi:hypothetical protein